MNLLALTDDPSRRILRVPLAQGVQSEVELLFKQQEAEFTSSAQEHHEFDGKYKPDDNECLFIKDYDDIDGLHYAVANPLSIAELRADPTEFASIKALFTGYTSPQGDKVALIQTFDRRKIISPSGLSIFHSANVFKKVDGVGLTLDNKLAAILAGRTLSFFSFHIARRIFDLSQYFVEATNSDLDDFAKSESVCVADQAAFIAMADSWVRRKITLVAQSKILENVDVHTIKRVAALFDIVIETKMIDGKEAILLPSEKADVKKLLRFLDEDYYQSPLQNLNFVTNSKRLVL